MVYHSLMSSRPAVRKQAAYADDVAAILNSRQIAISDHGYIDPWLLGYLWCMSGVQTPLWLRRKSGHKPFPGVTFKDAAVIADFFSRLDIAGDRWALIQQAQELEYQLHIDLVVASPDFEVSDIESSDPSSCYFLSGFEAAEIDIRRNDKIQAQVRLSELVAYLDASYLCPRCNHRVYVERLDYGTCLNCGL